MINFAELEPFTFVLEAAVVVGIIILFFLITAFILVKYPGLRCTPDGVTPELERELKETAAPPPVKTREIALPIPMTRSAPPPPPPPAPELLPPRAPRLIVHPGEPKYPKKEEKDGVSATVVIYERRPVIMSTSPVCTITACAHGFGAVMVGVWVRLARDAMHGLRSSS
eukprot:516660-Rhodomonas_salina.1